MTYTFTIRGNQDDPERGNPIPFERAVKGHWRERSSRYMTWQHYVRGEFFRAHPELEKASSDRMKLAIKRGVLKPFVGKETKTRVTCLITFADRTHGDGDNIHKGIIDALFYDDKLVAGCYDYRYSTDGHAAVDVTIEVGLPLDDGPTRAALQKSRRRSTPAPSHRVQNAPPAVTVRAAGSTAAKARPGPTPQSTRHHHARDG